MTDDRMALVELIEQGADSDLVREMLAFGAERIMDLEIEAKTGAPCGSRSSERLNHRNGYRERGWDTRVDRIDLAIPELRKGSYFIRSAATSSDLKPHRSGLASIRNRSPHAVELRAIRYQLAAYSGRG